MAEPDIVRFDRVTVRFGDEAALDSVSWSLRPGDTCVILGAAGSGKSVLLKTALGLIHPDEGTVTLFGRDTRDAHERDMAELRSQMGILFQEGGLFDSLTIEENVGYPLENQRSLRCPPEEVRPRVEEALNFVELGHTLDKFPSEISGGMRRRAGIARAIVTRPQLLLYDSPTAGLDPITANNIMILIAKERDLRRTTTALATHRYQDGHLLANYRYNASTGRLEAGETGTRFLVMRDGRIAFEGSQDELEASRDPYASKFAKPLRD
jgi:phospholipid/cholesterol/gamma-HCH transport system ATP-binding protein